MATLKQIAANRLNSRKSTGPRTPAGKAASAANSLKTGLYARSQIIAGEDPAQLRDLADQYIDRWQPATPEESFLVASLIDADWLLRRYALADARIWDYEGNTGCVRDDPNGFGLNFIRCREHFPLLQRRIDSAQRAWHRALRDLERLQATRERRPVAPSDPPAQPQPDFDQPQPTQPEIGFVPSFSPGTEPAACPEAPEPAPPPPVLVGFSSLLCAAFARLFLSWSSTAAPAAAFVLHFITILSPFRLVRQAIPRMRSAITAIPTIGFPLSGLVYGVCDCETSAPVQEVVVDSDAIQYHFGRSKSALGS